MSKGLYGHYNCRCSSIDLNDDMLKSGFENLKINRFFKQETGYDLADDDFKKVVIEGGVNADSVGDLQRIIRIFKSRAVVDGVITLKHMGYINEYKFHYKCLSEPLLINHWRLDEWLRMIMKKHIDYINLRLNEDKYSEKIKDKLVDEIRMAFTTNITDEKSYEEDDKENKEMNGLKIKKTEEMSIEEFQETEKSYDKLTIYLDEEKINEHKKDYGSFRMGYYWGNKNEQKIILQNEVIEFFPKALLISDATSVPYDMIAKIIGEYYIE